MKSFSIQGFIIPASSILHIRYTHDLTVVTLIGGTQFDLFRWKYQKEIDALLEYFKVD